MEKFRSIIGYALAILFIISWWALAFRQASKDNNIYTKIVSDPNVQKLFGDFQSRKKTNLRFFPQTHAAACILLSLVRPDELIALPSGLRTQAQIVPKEISDQILFDTESMDMEQIYFEAPDFAFVADYSNPSFIEKLERLGIKCVRLTFNRIEDIYQGIRNVGSLIGRSPQAEEMINEIETELKDIDTKLTKLRNTFNNVLILEYSHLFSISTKKTLSNQLLGRVNFPLHKEVLSDDWQKNINYEALFKEQPDCLIISCTNSKAAALALQQSPLASLECVKAGKCFFIDEVIQKSPTQHIIVAYNDLYEAILRASDR